VLLLEDNAINQMVVVGVLTSLSHPDMAQRPIDLMTQVNQGALGQQVNGSSG
jgi:hypothetical protein